MDFLINKDTRYSYQKLLKDLNDANDYCLLYQTDSLYAYFLNFIVALIVDKPLVLIDSDMNNNEIEELDNSALNQKTCIQKNQFVTFEDVIGRIQKSTSEISIFTSGTTGQPKKVVHNISTLTRSVRLSDKYKNQVWGYAYNPTHMAGLQVFFQAIENMNTLVNVFSQSRNTVYQLIDEYSITHLSATPTFYRLLLPFEKVFNSVQRITFGGEKSDKNLHESILKIFPNAKINNIYASTEAGSLFSASGECFKISEEIKDKIKVVDEELLIHKSLLGKSESFQFSGDYYQTGDLIEWEDESIGLFRFKSRKNELINVGGYKVNPHEVEEAILSIDGVDEAMVYAKPNSVLGNLLYANVKKNKSELTEIEIRNILNSKLQNFKVPRKINFVDDFTLTRTGKIQRK